MNFFFVKHVEYENPHNVVQHNKACRVQKDELENVSNKSSSKKYLTSYMDLCLLG
jgi:hypothetical protein